MSRSLNKAMLIGNVGQDPEIRSTTNGGRVATFSLATSRNWNGPTGERQEKTEWHRCVVWNAGRGQGGGGEKGMGLADVVEKYVKKGDKLFVEGPIEYRQWQDKENQTRYTTEIRVRELVMLSGRGGGGDFDNDAAPSRSARPAAAAKTGTAGSAGEFEDFPAALQDEDDDLPF
ncbi:MAG: single-stranded DNA-binding protein [Gemmatimonadota bacterium]|nr:single-stranded DNA-binding protein [Gemmatimonadota bacterium]